MRPTRVESAIRRKFIVTQTNGPFDLDVVVVGGCGHVGLPLAIGFASRGLRVGIYDINDEAVALVNSGQLPFQEPGAQPVLEKVLSDGLLAASRPRGHPRAEPVVVVIGTPVDEHLNPDPHAVGRVARGARRRTSATASCWCCAAPSTPASPR